MLGKYLDPKNDLAFKRIFGTEKNKDILIALLNEVLKGQIKSLVKDVSFLSPIQDPEARDKKQSIVDILAEDQQGNKYIVEMQVAPGTGFQERAQYYAAKVFISQMKKGGAYEDLREVIFLAFTNFDIFPRKEHYKSEHWISDKKTGENDLDKFSFTFVNLPKFDIQRIAGNKDLSLLTQEDKFYYFLHHGDETEPEELAQLVKDMPVLRRAYEELDRYYWTDEELRTYEDLEKTKMDNAAAMRFVENKGKTEGRAEGKVEGMQQGMQKGKKQGIWQGKAEILALLVKRGGITQREADELLK